MAYELFGCFFFIIVDSYIQIWGQRGWDLEWAKTSKYCTIDRDVKERKENIFIVRVYWR